MKRSRALGLAIIFTVIGLIIGITLSSDLGILSKAYTGDATSGKPAPEISSSSVDVLSKVSEAMVEVVSAIRPSVVNISSTKVVHTQGRRNPFFDDPFFRRFFGDDLFRQFDTPKEDKTTGLGSGVIVKDNGYILTNNHVIKDADEITVTLFDKSEYKGKIIGSDPKTDLAVVKIEATGLPAVKWGDSDELRVGETVIAVGTPYGLSSTVTSGIVSAKGRANVRIADYEDFIQTDAAINPGNSGGPLVNIKGELIGINTAIFSTSGGYQGIGFAIPSNMAHVVLNSLINEGKVIRGWLGVTIQTITKELATQFKLESDKGVLVSDVMADSPADKAGIKRGDIITEFEGKEIMNPLELRNTVAATKPGSSAKMTVIRDGKKKTISVTIGELPEEEAALTGDYENVLKGVSVQDLTPELRKNLGISKRVSGVVITDAPEETGLQRGDVILEVNKTSIENSEGYHNIVSKIKKGDSVLLLVYRNGSVFYMTLSG